MTRILFYLCNFLFIALTVSAQEQAGSIATNAVYIDADKMDKFDGPVAIIHKGSAAALLDTSGHILIPYGKYATLSTCAARGYIIATDPPNTHGYPDTYILDASGKMVFKVPRSVDGAMFEGIAADSFIHYRTIVWIPIAYNLYNKKKYSHDGKASRDNMQERAVTSMDWSEGYTTCGRGRTDELLGFIDHTGTKIIAPAYKSVTPFSDGISIVSQVDAFGATKYGGIDHNGKLVIPLQFSKSPTSFKYGYSIVEPVDRSEFQYAVINKKGEIVKKLDTLPRASPQRVNKVSDIRYFDAGFYIIYGFDGLFVMDSALNIISIDQFYKKFPQYEFLDNYFSRVEGYVKSIDYGNYYPGRFVKKSWMEYKNGERINHGVVILDFTDWNVKFIDVFSEYSFYDIRSGFAYAEKEMPDKKILKGYVNRQGVYKIVQKAPSVF